MFPPNKNQPVAPFAGQPRDDKKKPPRAAPGAGGYDSEEEEPPQDYCAWLMRRRDRELIPDAKRRWKMRAQLDAFPQREFMKIHGDASLQYEQPDNYCFATCAVYASFRRRGYSPLAIIDKLKNSAKLQSRIQTWQDAPFNHAFGFNVNRSISQRCTDIENSVHSLCVNFRGRPLSGMDMRARSPIIFTIPIGWYYGDSSDSLKSGAIQIDIGTNKIQVPEIPYPSPTGRTLQACLFKNFQSSHTYSAPLPKDPYKRTAIQYAEPFVLLTFNWIRGGKQVAHMVLVDFSDPNNVHLFDPNIGIIAPPAGMTSTGLEACLVYLWNHYVRPEDKSSPIQGLKLIRATGGQYFGFIGARQLYCQELPS